MTKLRLWFALLLTWLLVFFNIERFHEPLNIASFVYVLAAVVAILVVVLRNADGIRFGTLVAVMLFSLIVLKRMLGYQITGAALPITVTEACALLITAFVGRLIAMGIGEFEKNAHDVLHMHFDNHTPSLDSTQTQLYREVRRARKFSRPLTMLAMSASNAEQASVVSHFLEEIQQRGIRKYIDARLAQVLSDSISDCDLIAYGDHRFFVLCPELTHEQSAEVVRQLIENARTELGVELSVGAASFPNEEVTLGGLLEKAEAEMQGREAQQISTPDTFTPLDTPTVTVSETPSQS